MNWKEEATEKLRKYDAMRLAIQNLPEELKRLEQAACAIRSARVDGTPVKGGTNRREDMLLSNLVCREELANAFSQAKSWVATTDRALGVLTPEAYLASILYQPGAKCPGSALPGTGSGAFQYLSKTRSGSPPLHHGPLRHT